MDGGTFWGDTPWWLATVASVVLAFRRRKGFVPPLNTAPTTPEAGGEPPETSAATGEDAPSTAAAPATGGEAAAPSDAAVSSDLAPSASAKPANEPPQTEPAESAAKPTLPGFPKPGETKS